MKCKGKEQNEDLNILHCWKPGGKTFHTDHVKGEILRDGQMQNQETSSQVSSSGYKQVYFGGW